MRSLILTGGPSCFTACHGCYNHFARRSADTGALLSFIAQLRDSTGLDKITVGGGDPLTRPDILVLLAGLKALKLRIHLDTVGTALIRDAEIKFMGRGLIPQVDAAEVARLADLIGIPLDGSTDEVLNTFRTHTTVNEQQAVLELLEQLNAETCVNTVVHRGNAHDLPEIAAIIGRYECVREWQLFQFMPIGPLGWHNRRRFEVSHSAYRAAVELGRSAAACRLRIETKSATDRKNCYLLIDAEGTVWIPKQSPDPHWTDEDRNSRRCSLGHITDPHIFDRIAELDRHEFAEASQ